MVDVRRLKLNRELNLHPGQEKFSSPCCRRFDVGKMTENIGQSWIVGVQWDYETVPLRAFKFYAVAEHGAPSFLIFKTNIRFTAGGG
jgi:hypothetical protein